MKKSCVKTSEKRPFEAIPGFWGKNKQTAPPLKFGQFKRFSSLALRSLQLWKKPGDTGLTAVSQMFDGIGIEMLNEWVKKSFSDYHGHISF
jgi:hypothetical protein